MATAYLDTFRAEFGRAHKISRSQFRDLLIKLGSESGLDLRRHAGWYGVLETADLDTISRAIADAPREMTVLSLGGNAGRDIQYDQPGSMHPMQHAQLSFVSEGLAGGRYDADPDNNPGTTMEYLRRHAERVVVVTGELPALPLSTPEPPHKAPYYCPDCRDEVMADAGDDAKCPKCGGSVGQWFL